jgi:hypothetical protein
MQKCGLLLILALSVTAVVGLYSASFAKVTADNALGYLGLRLITSPSQVEVVAVAENSAAESAGIMPGDQIMQIQDKQIKNLSASEILKLLEGKAQTSVKLLIKRDNKIISKKVVRKSSPVLADTVVSKPEFVANDRQNVDSLRAQRRDGTISRQDYREQRRLARENIREEWIKSRERSQIDSQTRKQEASERAKELNVELEAAVKRVNDLREANKDKVKLVYALNDLTGKYISCGCSNENYENGEKAVACFSESVSLSGETSGIAAIDLNHALWLRAKQLVSWRCSLDVAKPIKQLLSLTEQLHGDSLYKCLDLLKQADLVCKEQPAKKVLFREIAEALVESERTNHNDEKEKLIAALAQLAEIEKLANRIDAEERVYTQMVEQGKGKKDLTASSLVALGKFYIRQKNFDKLAQVWSELITLSTQASLAEGWSSMNIESLIEPVTRCAGKTDLADSMSRQYAPIYIKNSYKSINSSMFYGGFSQAIKNIVNNYEQHYEYEKAESLLEFVISLEEKSIGLRDPGTNQFRILLSNVLLHHYIWCADHGDTAQAKRLYKSSQNLFQKALKLAGDYNGPSSLEVKRLLDSRATELRKAGFDDLEKAGRHM